MAEPITLEMPWAKDCPSELPPRLTREWLVTNGLGGYAAGTVSGGNTRRFHGLLIAALAAPLGRMMMLNHVEETVRLSDGRTARLDETSAGAPARLEFRREDGFPVWRFEVGGVVLEKTVFMPHLQNTVFLRYRMVSGQGPIELRLRPAMHFRHHEGRVDQPMTRPYKVDSFGGRYEVRAGEDGPSLKLQVYGQNAAFALDGGSFKEISYPVEQGRGYDWRGTLWSPGRLRADLAAEREAILGASTEPWEIFIAMDPKDTWSTDHERRARLRSLADPALRSGPGAEWALAADQFIVAPLTRVVHAARARALGDYIRTVVAGYHWFTDWGRDTMISLEGLALLTGRHAEAGSIIRMFSRYVKNGPIPNLFPESKNDGLYNTADATLWYFHAIDRYLAYTSDRATLSQLLPQLADIIKRHDEGTDFGIGVDPADGLLRQGQEGFQLTWMDAKVGDWVVTPRRGKAVEINALWYNALRLMERWTGEEGQAAAARPYRERADRVRDSFNRKFWNAGAGSLYDVIDGEARDLERLRPNQLFAVALPNPVLDPARWKSVVELVQRELLTPVGLRSLARGEPNRGRIALTALSDKVHELI